MSLTGYEKYGSSAVFWPIPAVEKNLGYVVVSLEDGPYSIKGPNQVKTIEGNALYFAYGDHTWRREPGQPDRKVSDLELVRGRVGCISWFRYKNEYVLAVLPR